ncbi:MAG TPA: MFS transporter [Opitutales bacterium]|nr:MFS transporter [Opitutales bacterium]
MEQVIQVETSPAATTYRYDRIKAPFYGILEAGWTTFALVIAIRYFDASETHKAFIAGAGPIGFLLAPLTLFIAAQFKARPSIACSVVFTLSAVLLAGASLIHTLLFFSLFAVTSQMAAVQHGPLMLQIYTENYTAKERGGRMTVPFILTAAFSILFSYSGGLILDWKISAYPLIFVAMILAALTSAFACFRMPSSPLSRDHIGNPWQNFSLIWKDKFFGFLLGSWMLLGLGNLIALPVRVDYLANPKFGINADNTTIAVLMMVIPAVARILSTKMWGHFFDRLHFVTTRNLLNTLFLFSIGLFFFSSNLVVLGIAMAFQGLAMGGGKIFWSLWVTKIAPDEKVSSYMSIHMALTGLRGTMAPFLGYWILSRSSPGLVAIIGMTLVTVSIILFELVRGHRRLRA